MCKHLETIILISKLQKKKMMQIQKQREWKQFVKQTVITFGDSAEFIASSWSQTILC